MFDGFRLATGAEEKPDVFLEGGSLPALPGGGSARFALSTDTLTDVRSPASAPCGWSHVKGASPYAWANTIRFSPFTES